MAKMKDSGVEWIGEIPEGWEVTNLKNIASVSRGGSPRPIEDYITDEEDGLNWIKIGDTKKGYKFIDQVHQKIRKDSLSKTRTVYKGDLILTNSMSFGEPYILNIDGCIHDGWVSLQQIKIDKLFLYYLLSSNLCTEQFNILTAGGVVQNLNINKIGSISILYPSLSIQQKISAYLDHKCAQIDATLTTIQQSIEKLKEYRQAVITGAVTKGLDPDARMKDSGVEWIGEIPEGWALVRFKNKFSFGRGLPITKADLIDTGIPVINYGQIHAKTNDGVHLTGDLIRFVSQEFLQTNPDSLLKYGDFVFADTSEDYEGIGNAIFIDYNSQIFAGYHTVICYPKKSENSKYIAYQFTTDIWRSQLRKVAAGIKVFSITQAMLSSTFILQPPIEEQQKIASYLDRKCAQIDALIAEKQKLHGKFTAYKKSLIYEYVTGKREVPDDWTK